jgi:DNA repair exonuclease SbcCD nuclease subunit
MKEAKRVFLISDTHLGVRSNSKEWCDIIEDYFQKFLIPLLKKESQPGDVLVHCGDVFDSRQSLNLYVLNLSISIFEEVSKILPVYMLVGNHDIFMKHTNDINSLKVFRNLKNVRVFEKPEKIQLGKKQAFFLPWVEDHKELQDLIRQNSADLLFCHADVSGFSFNKFTKIESGPELSSFSGYHRVYSGHIHYAQKRGNIRMLGSPYELTRSDSGNTKSVWLYDLEKDEETEYVNSVSPRFLRYKMEWVLEKSLDELQSIFFNNFIDISVSAEMSLHDHFSSLSEKLSGYRKLSHTLIDEAKVTEDEEISSEEEISVQNLIEKYVESTGHSEGLKEKIAQFSKKVYEEALKEIEERRTA